MTPLFTTLLTFERWRRTLTAAGFRVVADGCAP